MSDQPEQGGDSRTPQERKAVEAHMAGYDGRKMYMSPAGHFLAGYRSRDAEVADYTDDLLRIHNEKVDHFEARIAAERELAAAQAEIAAKNERVRVLEDALREVVERRSVRGYTSTNRRADDMAFIARAALADSSQSCLNSNGESSG